VRNTLSVVAEGGVDYFVAQTAVFRRAGSTLRLPLEVVDRFKAVVAGSEYTMKRKKQILKWHELVQAYNRILATCWKLQSL
jgi:hypothetical protein